MHVKAFHFLKRRVTLRQAVLLVVTVIADLYFDELSECILQCDLRRHSYAHTFLTYAPALPYIVISALRRPLTLTWRSLCPFRMHIVFAFRRAAYSHVTSEIYRDLKVRSRSWRGRVPFWACTCECCVAHGFRHGRCKG